MTKATAATVDRLALDALADLFARAEWRVNDSGASFIEAAHGIVSQRRNTEMRICRHCGRAIQADWDNDPDQWVDAPGLVYCASQDGDDELGDDLGAQRHEPRRAK